MGKQNLHNPDSTQPTQNQKNEMSDDPRDGARNSSTLAGETPAAADKPPRQDAQDQSTIEAFGERGAGIAEKE